MLAFRERRSGDVAVALAGGLFAVAFFTVHFGMFHLVHAVFLNLVFPLFARDGFPDAAALVQREHLNRYAPRVSRIKLKFAMQNASGCG